MAEEQKLNAALNIMRRMPPTTIENSLAGLIELVPDLTDELLTHVDQPLKTKQDPVSGKKFIVCDYNRDGDSYRSPWSNKYFPELEDGVVPSAKLREMEIEANGLLDVYRRMYFDSGESSAYYFNTEDDESQSFGACFLINKDVEGRTSASRGMSSGVWDSIHVFEVRKSDKVAGEYVYKLTTTVLVSMEVSSDKIGKVNLSGSMTQQLETKAVVSKDRPHLVSMGKMLEDMEGRIRNQIELVYIQKTREVVGGMRLVDGSRQKEWANLTASLNAAVLDHGHSRKTDG